MKTISTLLAFLSFFSLHAQLTPPEWTLLKSSTQNSAGVYGTKGTPAPNNIPAGKTYSAAWTDPAGKFWLFGGRTAENFGVQAYNDLWNYDPSTRQWTWVSGERSYSQGNYGVKGVPALTNAPPARAFPMEWTGKNGELWLFGGGSTTSVQASFLSDLWKYTPSTNMWTWVNGDNVANQPGVYGSRGIAEGTNKPGARAGGVTWTDASGNCWLFGGYLVNNNNYQYLNDLWKYDPTTNLWTWISGSNIQNQQGIYGQVGKPGPFTIPGARARSIGWTDVSGNFWLFGGTAETLNNSTTTLNLFNDLWMYNPANNTWTWVSGSNLLNQSGEYGKQGAEGGFNTPGAREDAVSWADSKGNFYLFGGYGFSSTTSSSLNDIWKYNLTSNKWTWIKGSSTNSTSGVYGNVGVQSAAYTPGGRGGAMAWSNSEGDLWLFGGLSNEFWKLKINPGLPSGYFRHLAYTAATSTGVQSFGGELGMEFTVNNENGIVIKQLGTFDHQGNGITGTQNGGIRVAIFDKATRTIVPGLDATIVGFADEYFGNYRLKNIDPVILMPGNYVVVAKGYNQNELNGNASLGSPVRFGDLGGGAISYTGLGLFGSDNPSTFAFPTIPDGGPAYIYLAGTFAFDVNPVVGNHLAYTSNTSSGVQSFGGELGMEFSVNNPDGISIKQLGAFDHGGDGITGTQNGGVRVAIFNKETRSIVPGLDAIISGLADGYVGNHRVKNITPITLMPGNYVVVAKGYNTNELNGNASLGSPVISGNNGNGAISYMGGGLFGSDDPATFAYPAITDGGPANLYLAGTFNYDINPHTTGHLAYTSVTSTGTQSFGAEVGMEFTVNDPAGIVVKQLGAFDNKGDGITGTQNGGIRVAIFNKATRTIVPGLDAIITGLADGYNGHHRMKNIAPVTLPPGVYMVVAKGYSGNESMGNLNYGSPITAGDNGNGAISYTGNCAYGTDDPSTFVYPSIRDGGPSVLYTAGTFYFESTSKVSHLAYAAGSSTGVQAYGGELGMEFTVNNPGGIVVKQLGAFDDNGDGITGGGIRVAIFNKGTKMIVPGLDAVIAGFGDGYVGNHRLKNVSPVALTPGTYAVVAKGFNTINPNGNGNSGSPIIDGDKGNGAISYSGLGLFGSDNPFTFNYPDNVDGGPANLYYAGTFKYDIAANQAARIAALTQADTVVAAAKESKSIGIRAYPNPTKGTFTVSLVNWKPSKTSIQIFNETGSLVEHKTISVAQAMPLLTVNMNLSGHPAGVYFVKVLEGDKSRVVKVVVTR